MSLKQAFSKIENYRDELMDICSKLIQCPSSHPEGRTVECVAYIKDYFDQPGISTEIYQRNKNKPNIVAKIRGHGKNKIMWIGHLDVVPAGKTESWTYPPYSGKITEDGFIWGRGASDMKGACAAAIIAARILNELKEIPNNVDFWFTADEEIGGVDGAYWLAQERFFQGEVCIIGDGSPGTSYNPAIDLGCKGSVRTWLKAWGKTAHGSRPFLGDNAIEKLLKVIPHVKKIANFPLDIPDELEPIITSTIEYMEKEEFDDKQKAALLRLFHYPSITLNILNGGVKTNVVPDYAEAYFDIRLTSGSKPVRIRNTISNYVKEACEPDVKVEFLKPSNTAGYYESPKTLFAKQLAEAVELSTGKKPIFKLLTGGTDAVRIKRFIDVPCLGFGSSIEGQAHAPDEHNHIELLNMSTKVYTVFPLIYKN
ncbi:MAG: ArgE/DapE family deacylase [Candidatus Bathyarchaeota archaeon]|nr:MAG: ArgE/DapE family deacylase [Candidatus Bathyarchaeota archaeon]